MKVEILTSELTLLSGKSKKTGNDYAMALQEAFLHRPGQKYPEKFEITLPRERQDSEGNWAGYQPGMYELDMAQSVEVFGNRLSLRPVLVPVKPSLKAAQ